MKVRTFWDSLVSVAAMFFFAAPSFWLGIMLIVLFAVKLGWLPVGGMATIGGGGGVLDILHHLILPTLALGLFYAAIYARVMRSSMLEVAQLDFVRTARAKGLRAPRSRSPTCCATRCCRSSPSSACRWARCWPAAW